MTAPPPPLLQWCPDCAAATTSEECPWCGGLVCAACGLVDWPYGDEERMCRVCRDAELAAEAYEPDGDE